jgi:hypothetical protein
MENKDIQQIDEIFNKIQKFRQEIGLNPNSEMSKMIPILDEVIKLRQDVNKLKINIHNQTNG